MTAIHPRPLTVAIFLLVAPVLALASWMASLMVPLIAVKVATAVVRAVLGA
jgi:hypothetical protein